VSTTPALTLIAARDRRGAIGRAGALPWHLPDDLRRFKALTLGRPILMGRRTATALGHALPGRRNLVLTRSGCAPFEDMQAVASLDAALAAAGDVPELCVIGGGEIYALTLARATRLHLTEVATVVAGADAFFPDFQRSGWREVARTHHPADARHALPFDFVELQRA
jgi:dihydrofolate reductase